MRHNASRISLIVLLGSLVYLRTYNSFLSVANTWLSTYLRLSCAYLIEYLFMIDFSTLLIPIAHAAEAEASTSAIGTLGLNLKLFIAQLINFAIILLVLWNWVFTPLSKKLTERTENIEKAMHDAKRIEKDKQDFEKWKNEQIINARHEAASIITLAKNDATKVKDQLAQAAKEEQEKIVAQAKAQIEQEKNQQLRSAKSELADLVTNATEKIIREKLNDKKDADLIKSVLASTKYENN